MGPGLRAVRGLLAYIGPRIIVVVSIAVRRNLEEFLAITLLLTVCIRFMSYFSREPEDAGAHW